MSIVEDLVVVVVVNAVVAVLKKLLLGHLAPFKKPPFELVWIEGGLFIPLLFPLDMLELKTALEIKF